MTIREAISYVRNIIGGYDDDSKYSDEFLYTAIVNASTIIFSRLEAAGKPIPNSFFSKFYVILEEVDDNECLPAYMRCKVYQTPFEIPDVLFGRSATYFRVIYGNTELPKHTKGLQYSFIMRKLPTWEVVNRKLRVYHSHPVKGVYVKGIFPDITAWFDKICDPITNTIQEPCDFYDMQYPLLADTSYRSMAFDLVKQEILQDLSIPDQEDVDNENKSS